MPLCGMIYKLYNLELAYKSYHCEILRHWARHNTLNYADFLCLLDWS